MKAKRLLMLVGGLGFCLVLAAGFVGCSREATDDDGAAAETQLESPHGDREKPGVWRKDGIVIVQQGRGEPNDNGRLFQVIFPQPVALSQEVAFMDIWEARWNEGLRSDEDCPLVLDPPLPLNYTWESDTRCMVEVAAPADPDTVYTLSLRDGLATTGGDSLDSDIIARYRSQPFRVVNLWVHDQYVGKSLSRFPMATLSFNHSISAEKIAQLVYFQTRDGRNKFPVDVLLRPWDDPESTGEFTIKASEGLAGGEEVDLIVERLESDFPGRRMRHLRVQSIGVTRHPYVKWVLAANRPNESPEIQVQFSENLQPGSIASGAVSVEPAVADLVLVPVKNNLFLRGGFDPRIRYTVTVNEAVKARSGFGVAEIETWGATFASKRPSLSFRGSSAFYGDRSDGLSLSFVQTNTQSVRWNLRPVSAENFWFIREAINERMEEVESATRTEEMNAALPDEVLDLTGGPVVTGDFPANANREDERRIELAAGDVPDYDAFLLELISTSADGRQVGNARLISLGDHALVLKRGPKESELTAITTADGAVHSGAQVTVFDDSGREAFSGLTDLDGRFTFSGEAMAFAMVRSEIGTTLRWLQDGAFPSGSDYVPDDDEPVVEVFTDRGLYRPGETAHIKAIGRIRSPGGALRLPDQERVAWQIEESRSGNVVASGDSTVSPDGGWALEWQVPEHAASGEYVYTDELDAYAPFGVEEFRRPLFSVLAQAEDSVGSEAKVVISSEYFYLEPNAGAEVEWEAEWTIDDLPQDYDYNEDMNLVTQWELSFNNYSPLQSFPDGHGDDDMGYGDGPVSGPRFSLIDQFSRKAPGQGFTYEMVSEIAKAGGSVRWDDSQVYSSAKASGTVKLDADGRAEIVCPSPFPQDALLRRAGVYWTFKVTSVEGQSFDSAAESRVQFTPEILAARVLRAGNQRVGVEVMALDPANKPVRGVPVEATVYRVDYRTTLEKTGDHVVHYNNEPVFEKVWNATLPTPLNEMVEVPRGGRYVVVARAAENSKVPQVSASVLVGGEEGERVAVAVDDLHNVRMTPVGESFKVGDTVDIEIESPFSGQGWLTIETDRILHRQRLELKGNAMTVILPVQPGYFPNAEVTLFVLRPRSADGATPAAEAFGHCTIQVEDPVRRLQVDPQMSRQFFEPRDRVEGSVIVTIDGQPLADAEVTLFAVDRAIQDLALWEPPDLGAVFHRQRPYAVATHRGLGGFGGLADPDSFFQKGYIVGGGGGKIGGQLTRQNAQPVAYWDPSLRTDADGRVEFAFDAPDTLTTYRVTAVAHSGVDRFGTGSNEFTVKKKLWINPALPRFLREGDSFELTGSINQTARPEDQVTVTCKVSGEVSLGGPPELPLTVGEGAGVLARFKGRVEADSGEANIVLSAVSAADPSLNDAIQVTLPVLSRGIERKAFTSKRSEDGTVEAAALALDEWQGKRGEFEVYLSGTENLPRFLGIPQIMGFPHGCLEQRSSKLLSYALFGDLFDNLPAKLSGTSDYERSLGDRLRIIESASIEMPPWDNHFGVRCEGVPYWAGGSKINPFATVQVTWALLEARATGIGVDDEKLKSLLGGTRAVAENRTARRVSRIVRAYALLVLSRVDELGEEGRVDLIEEDSWQQVREAVLASAVEIYSRRERLGDDGTAFLALAMHQFGTLDEEKQTLMEELGRQPDRSAFDPKTFGSATRDEALRLAARIQVKDQALTAAEVSEAEGALSKLMAASSNLSNQENLWLLYVMRALENRGAATAADLSERAFTVMPASFSPNGATAMWERMPLSDLATTRLAFTDGASLPLSAVMIARYQDRGDGGVEGRGDSGLRLSRRLRNLSEPGADADSLSVGDDVLITYTIETDRPHSFVALVDHLPACIETVNPDLPLVGKFFKLPNDVAASSLSLSHSELLDDRTLIYFDDLPAGIHHFTTLARVTSAGVFHWPPSQVSTMYDSRFEATTVGSTATATASR